MKHYHWLYSLLLGLCIGCVTMPEPVSDSYMIDKTKDEQKLISELQEKIVSKKLEMDNYRDTVKKADQTLLRSRSEFSVLNKKKSLFMEEQKLALVKEDQAAANEIQEQINGNELLIQKQKLHVRFSELMKANAEATGKIKESELAVLVAEMSYEKAKVAKKYFDKRNKELGKDKEEPSFFSRLFGGGGNDTIDTSRYLAYLEKLRDRLKADRESQKETETKAEAAEKAFNSFTSQ